MKNDFKCLRWECDKEDEHMRAWGFERADGSYMGTPSSRNADRIFFWYGIQDMGVVKRLCEDFTSTSRESATAGKTGMLRGEMGVRRFSTYTSSFSRIQARRFSSSTLSMEKKRLGLIGARGHTGRELINILSNHPNIDLSFISSRELAGTKCKEYTKSPLKYTNLSVEDVQHLSTSKEVDVWVMALPNGVCKPFVEGIDQVSSKFNPLILDLSADYRFDKTGKWAYGVPELYDSRKNIRDAKRISNPGCYATGSQLAIAPLLQLLDRDQMPTIFGISGYSGAGTKPSPKNDPTRLKDNLIPYSLTGHIHEREVSAKLGVQVGFMPHVASWFQGITLTVSIPLAPWTKLDHDSLSSHFKEFYRGEKLIEILDDIPEVRDISGKHGVRLGGFVVSKDGKRAVIVSNIDNLLKGAATQAVQVRS